MSPLSREGVCVALTATHGHLRFRSVVKPMAGVSISLNRNLGQNKLHANFKKWPLACINMQDKPLRSAQRLPSGQSVKYKRLLWDTDSQHAVQLTNFEHLRERLTVTATKELHTQLDEL